ncbi:MAG TPA: FHA domain-containing protein [Fimbriiglobus sp.]|jgi:predicted component of type VI protein secretion system
MKVNLVVATGVHEGKVIPILGTEFLIGRDPQCQLRPASQAVSKQHCAVLVRDGKLYVKDYGSTNGTFLNEEQITPNGEMELQAEDRLRIGPLDFSIQVVVPRPSDSTPLPEALRRMTPGTVEKVRLTAGGSAVAQPPVPKPEPVPISTATDDEQDKMAAMLLGMDDDAESPPKVPEGSTIMEMPAVLAEAGKAEEKKPAVKEDTSNAASEILRRYMRRPR